VIFDGGNGRVLIKPDRSSLIDQAMMDRVESQFQPVGYSELIENVVQVILHRLLANE
jgi:hypothetical protein